MDRRTGSCHSDFAPLTGDLVDEPGISRALHELGEVATWQEDYGAAIGLYEEAISRAARVGKSAAWLDEQPGRRGTRPGVTMTTSAHASLQRKRSLFFKGRTTGRALQPHLSNLALANLHVDRASDALISQKESLEISQELGFDEVTAWSLQTVAALLAEQRKGASRGRGSSSQHDARRRGRTWCQRRRSRRRRSPKSLRGNPRALLAWKRRPCITGASRGSLATPFYATTANSRTAWLSHLRPFPWRSDEESGLEVC